MLTLRISNSRGIRSIPIRTSQLLYYSDDKKTSSETKSKEGSKNESKEDMDKKNAAAERLNKLLASMQTNDRLTQIKKVNVVTTAVGRKSQKEKAKSKQNDNEKKPKNILEAAKNVADLINSDDKKQTESELLSKLRGHIEGTLMISPEGKIATNDTKDLNLRDVIVGMKIDRTRPQQQTLPPSRGQYVRKTIDDRYESKQQRHFPRFTEISTEPHPSKGSVKLFNGEPIGIFKSKNELNPSPDILKTWDYLYQRELKLSVTHPPANYFQKMALWTEQGKMWKFPIDNEQGLDEEAKVDFSEHIFMEQHLEGWCPDKGPIRHFMELVCVGLSKNPYITAQDKKEHILWYRDYFEQKKDIIKELIVQKEDSSSTTKPKGIESN